MVLRTLLSHYRRHPVQAAFLLVGIVIANALLAGTLFINAQARASYEDGEQLLQATPVAEIRARSRAGLIDEREYIRLRREGFDMLAPVLQKTLLTADGTALEVLGIEIFALSGIRDANTGFTNGLGATGGLDGFSFAPWQLWIAPARMRQLGWQEGQRVRLESGRDLPPVTAVEGSELGHRLLLDIGALQALSGTSGEISWISVFSASPERLDRLRNSLPGHLEYVDLANVPDPGAMTRSFHLNLAAMGLLAFVVGVFLMYNAISFSYTDRHDLIRRMKLAGVDRSHLRRGLVTELAVFVVLGSAIGYWLGAQLAVWLLPGVGQTLAQLYDVYIAYPDGFVPGAAWLPVSMTLLAALLSAALPLREALDAPLLERWQLRWRQQTMARRDRVMLLAGLLFLLLSAALTSASWLWLTLAGMACLLLGAALLLPLALRLMLSVLQRGVSPRQARLGWLVADSRWLLGPAALALMAMTLALVANSGLNTMIDSFRAATDQWLEQRLAADLFLRAPNDLDEIQSRVDALAPGVNAVERYRTAVDAPAPAGGFSRVEVVSLQDGERFRDSVDLVFGVAEAAALFEAGQGIYISERSWRLDGWQPGQTVEACPTGEALPVLGVYHDYGNPLSQWLVSRDLFLACWPGLTPVSFSLYGPEGTPWENVRSGLIEALDLAEESVIDQKALKSVGMSVFDRTFAVTRALNGLTLLVAAIGIFCAVSAIHHHRVDQQALLASLGISRRQRGAMLLAQWGLLGLLCLVLVWPFGMLLAGYLASVVTPAAFGWSFPLQIDAARYLELAAWAMVSLFLAVLLPSLRLLRASPAALLRENSL